MNARQESEDAEWFFPFRIPTGDQIKGFWRRARRQAPGRGQREGRVLQQHGEKIGQHKTEPKDRHGYADIGADHGADIERRFVAVGAQYANGHTDADSE